jgi:hypothetical protein
LASCTRGGHVMSKFSVSGKAMAAALFLAGAAFVHAQGTAIVSQSSDAKELQLYKSPSRNDRAAMIPAQGFPWTVKSKSKGFYEVSTPGGSGWINAMDVRTEPQASVVCSVPPAGMHVARSLNASSDRCKQP